MLTDNDKEWIKKHYPDILVESDDKISGKVSFTGSYNKDTEHFLQIESDSIDDVGGLRLSGTFQISVATRTTTPHSRLPALTIEGIETIADRHINQSDFTACLCNPIEEDEYLEPRFCFQKYFKELVIPFLYGQVYYSQEKHWPWFDYAHGGLGTIEAFFKNPTPDKANECIHAISKEVRLWKIVKPLLLQKEEIKGHTICPCPKHDHIRRCHLVVLQGLKLLRKVARDYNILIA